MATRASSSIPGLAPPLLMDDHLLVDGGIVNNVPADVMRDRSGGRILAVRVGEAGEVPGDADIYFSPNLLAANSKSYLLFYLGFYWSSIVGFS